MSDEVSVDLTGYKDRVGSRVAPGRYRVIVEDAEVDKAASGNTMINLWLRILGTEFDGATVVDRLVLTEKSLFRIVGFMQALGMQTPKKKLRVNVRKFVGQSLDIDVEDGDPYNGRVKSEVRGYFRIEKGAAAADLPEMSAEEVEQGLAEFAGSGDTPEAVDLDKIDLG